MNLADFQALDDWEKLVVVEIEVGRKLQGEAWVQCGSGVTNAFYISLLDDGEVHRVEIDGSALTEKFSIADCHGTASTFYYDDLAKILYIHTPDSDDPAESGPKYNIVAFWWEYFSNRPKPLQPYVHKYGMFLYGAEPKYGEYTIGPYEDILKEANGSLEFWTTATDAEEVTETTPGGSTVNKETTEVDGDKSYASARLDINAGNDLAQIRWTVTLPPRRKVKIRVRYKNSVAGKTSYLAVVDSGTNVYLNSSYEWQAGATAISIANSTSWATFEVEFITHESYSTYYVALRNNAAASSSIYFDNVEVWRYRQAVDCKPYLPKEQLPTIHQSVGDYYMPDERIAYGSVYLNNVDGWFWTRREPQGYLWHNKNARLRVGRLDEGYENLTLFYTGLTTNPVWGKIVEISIKDERVLLQKIPTTRFDSTTWPDCEDAWKNKPVPILLGLVEDINPPQCDTTAKKFKISETTFGGTTYGIHSIDAVYKNGVLLAGGGVDYNVDLPNGEFTLVCAWAAGDIITCDARGLKIRFDDWIIAYNAGDWSYFLYVLLNGVSKYKLDIAAIVDLQTNRNVFLSTWIASEKDSIDFLINMKKSAVFQTYQRGDGMITFYRYSADVPSDAPRYYAWDYIDHPKFREDTDQCFKEVVIKGHWFPYSGYYEYEEEDSEDATEWNHNEKERLVMDTMIHMQLQCQTMAANYLSMVKNPIEFIDGVTLPASALLLNPCEKFYLTYVLKDDDGNDITIYEDEVFRVLSLDKDLNTGQVTVKAIKDESDLFWVFA